MTRAEVFERLTGIFLDVMDLDEVALAEETTARDIEEWDSLSHIRLVVSVERGFGIKFTNAEVEGMTRVGDLVDAILARAG